MKMEKEEVVDGDEDDGKERSMGIIDPELPRAAHF